MNDDLKRIERFLNGDETAYNELVLSHRNWVVNFIENLTKNKDDAEDIAQDVFVKVYFGLKSFRNESTFKTWLYRIVINQLNNYFRKQKLLSWFQQDLDDSHGEDERNENHPETKRKLVKMVNKLPRMQRNVVLLRIFQDMTFRQVADILSITENSAKVSFHKAKRNLEGYINV